MGLILYAVSVLGIALGLGFLVEGLWGPAVTSLVIGAATLAPVWIRWGRGRMENQDDKAP